MDDVGRSILWFSLAILALLLSVLFSAANEAYDDAGVSRLRKLYEEDGDKRAEKLLRLQSKVQPYALRLNLCGGLAMLLSAVFSLIGIWGLTQVWWQILLGIVVTIWLVLFFGLALPRVIAENHPTEFVLKMQKPLCFLAALFAPFSETTYAAAVLNSKRSEEMPKEDERTEEEIRLLVAAGTDSGAIEESENEMIDNIFEFDDRTVGEVMTHRTDVFAVDEKASLDEILELVLHEGISRIPVYRDRIDKVIGVLYVKDLLRLLADPQREFSLGNFVRPVLYTPEQTMCNTLFREFQVKKIHFAIVVDEYGGTAGVVTMEDLLEAIVGNIQDEYDHEEDLIHKNEDGSYLLSGDVELGHLKKELNLTFPNADSADTLCGILINQLERIPEENEHPSITMDGWTLHIKQIADQHIELVHAIPIEKQEESSTDVKKNFAESKKNTSDSKKNSAESKKNTSETKKSTKE